MNLHRPGMAVSIERSVWNSEEEHSFQDPSSQAWIINWRDEVKMGTQVFSRNIRRAHKQVSIYDDNHTGDIFMRFAKPNDGNTLADIQSVLFWYAKFCIVFISSHLTDKSARTHSWFNLQIKTKCKIF